MTKFEEFRFKYPNAFITDGSPYVFVLFGFECSEGWADLLEPVFKYIDEYNTKIVLNQGNDVSDFIQIRQVKEKFGTLRFYVASADEQCYKLIEEAEHKSQETCEVCGQNGELKGTSWVYTACPEHTKIGDK